MEHQSVRNQVLNAVATSLPDVNKTNLSNETLFREHLGMDSLDGFEILLELEDTFDLMLAETEMEGIETIEDLIGFILKKKEEGS